jgi:endonuclease/exonuclease/phosphatase family metal-dependent hydrolase
VPKGFVERVKSREVVTAAAAVKGSDHFPLMAEIEF